MAMDNEQVAELLQQVQTASQVYLSRDAGSTNNGALATTERQGFAEAARRLADALEDPVERAQRFALQPLAQSCLCAAWKCGLLTDWPEQRMSAEVLAKHTGADRRLIGKS